MLAVTAFYTCFYIIWAVVADDEHGGLRNESERRWSRWAGMTPNMELSHWSCETFITPLHCHASLFVQNRFVMYITRAQVRLFYVNQLFMYITRIILLTQLQYSFVCEKSIHRYVMYITCCVCKSIMYAKFYVYNIFLCVNLWVLSLQRKARRWKWHDILSSKKGKYMKLLWI